MENFYTATTAICFCSSSSSSSSSSSAAACYNDASIAKAPQRKTILTSSVKLAALLGVVSREIAKLARKGVVDGFTTG